MKWSRSKTHLPNLSTFKCIELFQLWFTWKAVPKVVIAPDLLSYSITAQLRSSSFKLSSCWAIHNLSIKTMTGRRLMQRRSRCQKPVAICKTSLEFSIGILHWNSPQHGENRQQKWGIYKMRMVLWVKKLDGITNFAVISKIWRRIIGGLIQRTMYRRYRRL